VVDANIQPKVLAHGWGLRGRVPMLIIPPAIPMEMELECGACGRRRPYKLPTPACDACGHDWMDVRYDYERITRLWPNLLQPRPFTMWRYRGLVPLRDSDSQISEAHTGRDGLALIERDHPDLVSLDLMMSDMDGSELLDELEANDMLNNLPVITISAKELTREDRARLQGQIQMLLQKGSLMDEDLLVGIAELLGDN